MTTFFEGDNNDSEKLQECDSSEKRQYQKSKDKSNGGLSKRNLDSLEVKEHQSRKVR